MKTCAWCKNENYDGVHSNYCNECLSRINKLNRAVIEGPREARIVWPYHPVEKLAYALKTGDYAGTNFEGTQKGKIPKAVILEVAPYAGPPLENIKGNHFTVYFLFEIATGLIKIGRTEKIKKRIWCYAKDRYTVLGVQTNANFLQEPYLHRRFSDERVKSSFFEASPRLLRYIRRFTVPYRPVDRRYKLSSAPQRAAQHRTFILRRFAAVA